MIDPEILKRAKQIIKDRDNWSRNAYGRDGSGFEVVKVRDAMSFCMLGAICAASGMEEFIPPSKIEIFLCRVIEGYEEMTGVPRSMQSSSVGEFNDNHDHAEIMALFDEAIKDAEKALETAS